MVRQNWIAASKNTAGLPSGGARQGMFLSNQISGEPLLRSEDLERAQFVVR